MVQMGYELEAFHIVVHCSRNRAMKKHETSKTLYIERFEKMNFCFKHFFILRKLSSLY